jgi:hypothetical protein
VSGAVAPVVTSSPIALVGFEGSTSDEVLPPAQVVGVLTVPTDAEATEVSSTADPIDAEPPAPAPISDRRFVTGTSSASLPLP